MQCALLATRSRPGTVQTCFSSVCRTSEKIIVMMNLYEECGENDMETTNLVPNPKRNLDRERLKLKKRHDTVVDSRPKWMKCWPIPRETQESQLHSVRRRFIYIFTDNLGVYYYTFIYILTDTLGVH
jgi:hypothetical protein